MDIVAHALWAGAGGRVLSRRLSFPRSTLAWMIGLSVLPDIVPILPVLAFAIVSPRSLQFALAYVSATPGLEPELPTWLSTLTHHLHCTMHSVVILGVVSGVAWLTVHRFPLALLGWWSHVFIDVPTHSAAYYAVPLFYPFSDRAFDGIAWTKPWFMVLNYAALAATYVWLHRSRQGPVAEVPPSK